MKVLIDKEEQQALFYIDKAVEIASCFSSCKRSRCGSLIVQDYKIIGCGANSPPGNFEEQRRCTCAKSSYHNKVTDKTCCVHAEQRAIMDALRKNPDAITGSRLYFVRLDELERPSRSGNPYCTICSKMALDVGIKEFVLWREEGVCVYNTLEYNLLSFNFKR